ncbi:MAG TPA: TetR family transcriptional regulator [Candidatus Limnocylindrales bacterium]
MSVGGGPIDVDPARRAPGRDRTNARGEATRELILLTAERLFAERGIEAVPLRDIGQAADQKNNFAVQYHFGDRENLVRAIAEYRSRSVLAANEALAADLSTGAPEPTVTDLVRSFVTALATNLEGDSHFLGFVSRYIIERGGYAGLDAAVPTGSIKTIRASFLRLLPTHTDALLDERWEILFTSAVHALARYQVAMRKGALAAPLDFLIEDLVRSLTAALAEPPPGGVSGGARGAAAGTTGHPATAGCLAAARGPSGGRRRGTATR